MTKLPKDPLHSFGSEVSQTIIEDNQYIIHLTISLLILLLLLNDSEYDLIDLVQIITYQRDCFILPNWPGGKIIVHTWGYPEHLFKVFGIETVYSIQNKCTFT